MMKRLSADSPSRTIAWPGANVRCLAFAMTEARTFGDRTASNGMDAVLCGSMVPPGRRTAGIRQPRQVYPARQVQMGDSRGSQVGSVVGQRTRVPVSNCGVRCVTYGTLRRSCAR